MFASGLGSPSSGGTERYSNLSHSAIESLMGFDRRNPVYVMKACNGMQTVHGYC